MTKGPEFLFPPSDVVFTLPVLGPPRLGTSASGVGQRYRDGALYPASHVRARMARGVSRWFLAAGLVHKVRGTADEEACELVSHVLGAVPASARFVVVMGTPGKASKATMVVVSAENRALAYAKVAWSETARALVRHEARIVALAGDVIAPEVVCAHESRSLSCVVTSALIGEPVGVDDAPPIALVSRALSGNVTAAPPSHPFCLAMSRADPDLGGRAIDLLGGDEYAVGVTHGDAAPWNAVDCVDGKVRLFDWEYGREQGMPLADVAHWLLQVSHLIRRYTPGRAVARAVTDLAGLCRLDERQAAGVCALASTDVSRRLSGEGETASATWWRECARAAVDVGEKASR